MKKNTLVIRRRIVEITTAVAVILAGLMFSLISVYSVLQTCRINSDNPTSEQILFQNDNVAVNIALLVLTILGLLVLIRKNVHLSRINTKLIVGIMLVITTAIPLVWALTVRSVAGGDTAVMLRSARDATQGVWSDFTTPYAGSYSYYQFYPFRLGYVFFAEILFKIFGAESSDLLLQIPNVIALQFAYVALVMIANRLFKQKAVTNMTAIALIVCFQPMFITTQTSGIIIGLALALWAIFFTIRYIQDNKLLFGGLAILLMTLAVLIRYTYMILLAAVVIALILHVIGKKRFIALAVASLMILCPIGFQMILEQAYASSSGVDLGSRVTDTLYAYMGVTEDEGSSRYAGWFSFVAVNTMTENNMDIRVAEAKANEEIKSRRQQLQDEGRLTEFYTTKLLSQINEPSYQSIWVSQVSEHDLPEPTPENPEPFPKLAKSVYTGGLSRILDRWFNYYNMIIFFGFVAGSVRIIIKKKLTPEIMILPAAVFGGLLYHTICEAKSQFMLPFFVMLIPFAVYGILHTIRALQKITDGLFKVN